MQVIWNISEANASNKKLRPWVLFTKEHLLGWPISVLVVPDVHTYRKGTQSNLASERWLLLNVLFAMNIFLTCILDRFPEFVLIYLTPGFSHTFIPLLYLTNHPFTYPHKIGLMWFLILSLYWLLFSVLTICINSICNLDFL